MSQKIVVPAGMMDAAMDAKQPEAHTLRERKYMQSVVTAARGKESR